MTSLRQIEANSRNALQKKPVRPRKMANDGSDKNAVRHGLSAETIIDIVEDIPDYRGFDEAFFAEL
jgi:hypothetical protein